MSGKVRTVCSVISFALVALLSCFVGYRIMTVIALVLSSVLLSNVCYSLYNRLINKANACTWAYWVTVACTVLGVFFLIWNSSTGWNPVLWFAVAFFVVAVVCGIVDYKVLLPKTKTETTTETK